MFCLMGVLKRPGPQSKRSEMVRGTNLLKNEMKCDEVKVFEVGGLFSSDWTCPPLTIENASVNRKNPPYSRNTNYTVKCNSGLVLLNDATSTSYKITCDQDLNWVGNTSTWPQCVESKYLQKEGTFPLLEYHFTSAFYCDKNDLPALSAHKTRIRTLPVHEICEYTEPRPYLISSSCCPFV